MLPIQWSSRTRWLKTAVRVGGPLAVILLAHVPLVLVHFSNLWRTGLHGHFAFVLAAAAGLFWSRWYGARVPGRWQSAGSTLSLACGYLLLFLGIRIDSPWLGYVAVLVSSGAILLRICPAPVKKWGPVWLLLWLLLPLPMGLDRQLSLELQSYSSRSASLLLDFFQVHHLRTGNVIEIPGMAFSVEEACSGIQSLFVLSAAAAILAVVRQRHVLHTLGLIASVAGWAGAANMVRVAGVVISAGQFGVDLATGWRHELWGFALFGTALGLILSTDRLLWLSFSPADNSFGRRDYDDYFEEQDALPPPHPASPPDRLRVGRHRGNIYWRKQSGGEETQPRLGILQSWTVAGMFACLGVLQCVPRSTVSPWPVPAPTISLTTLSAATLPAEFAGWRRLGFETERRGPGNTDGVFSAIWRYERGGWEAVVSLDFPFTSWHPLTQCYRGRGGRVLDWHVEPLANEAVAEHNSQPRFEELAVASLELERGRPATLYFAEWNADGVMLVPPATEGPSWARLLTDLKQRWARFDSADSADRCVYQFQVLIPRPRQPSMNGDATAVRRLFVESLRLLRSRTVKQPGGVP